MTPTVSNNVYGARFLLDNCYSSGERGLVEKIIRVKYTFYSDISGSYENRFKTNGNETNDRFFNFTPFVMQYSKLYLLSSKIQFLHNRIFIF